MAGNAELVKSVNHAHAEIDRLKAHLDKCFGHQAEFERRLQLVEKQNYELKLYAEDLEDHILSLDTASRKKNLIITGLSEEQGETNEALPLRIYNYLMPYIETIDISDIDCAYRLGKSTGRGNDRSRPILCKFTKEQARNDLAAIRPNLNDVDSVSRIYQNDDLPQAVNERKAKFRLITKMAKQKKIPVSSNNDKITVNSITYSFRNLDCLPEGLSLEDVVRVKGGLAFFSENAWLSNFYPTEIEIQGMKFHSVEHAYQYTQAM